MKDTHTTSLPITFSAPTAPALPERVAKRKGMFFGHRRKGIAFGYTGSGKKWITHRVRRMMARDALVDRLRQKGAAADAGRTIDTTGMSDQEFIALLRR